MLYHQIRLLLGILANFYAAARFVAPMHPEVDWRNITWVVQWEDNIRVGKSQGNKLSPATRKHDHVRNLCPLSVQQHCTSIGDNRSCQEFTVMDSELSEVDFRVRGHRILNEDEWKL